METCAGGLQQWRWWPSHVKGAEEDGDITAAVGATGTVPVLKGDERAAPAGQRYNT